jgi:hypothetical protein
VAAKGLATASLDPVESLQLGQAAKGTAAALLSLKNSVVAAEQVLSTANLFCLVGIDRGLCRMGP